MQPEELVVQQSEKIMDDHTLVYIEDKAYFYIILNGSFKVSSLRFNKNKKKDQIDH